jgi:beta-glucosidase/6-phospho-beta-glucosidase/beta-galactosidase
MSGGWLNSSAADWFEEYARLCYTEFGDDVKFWITLNEPKETAYQGTQHLLPFRPSSRAHLAINVYLKCLLQG